MSNTDHNDEIDLLQIFKMIKNGFKSFLKLIISIISFYKKKAILFLVLLVVGVVVGYFIDQNQDSKNEYIQEVIIEPKHDSVEHIYGFIGGLQDNFKDSIYVKNLGLEVALVENIEKILIEPIIQPEEVLSALQEKYGGKESFIESYDEKLLRGEKYRNFYQRHKLTVSFKNKNTNNYKIIKTILDYVKSNDYFEELITLELKQTKSSLDQNKKSLQFINQYLTSLSNNPNKSDGKLIFATESETPTISSLLKRKETLIAKINSEEKLLALDKELFSIIDYGDVVSKRKMLLGRTFLIIPLVLFSIVSLFYFFKYLSRSVHNFVKEEE
ncbi:hypothetical protein [Aquimarina longa]|uniref:hypothetical protein n=1 Tax=Aquimarina longa TaxID=1080221 RepID=UPI000AD2E87F|nr:hypothetical protein [Aquimarina longa]